MKKVKVRLEAEQLRVKVRPADENPIKIKVNSEIVQVGDYEHYEGDYSVTPKFKNQTLNTKNKVMDFDVDVKTIPIEKISNSSGGNTVIIGG